MKSPFSFFASALLVTCRPEPDVTWYHGNEEMVRSSRVSFQHDKGVYRMTVLDLNVKDAGEWRCKAVNSYGEAWCSCDLKVLGQCKTLEYQFIDRVGGGGGGGSLWGRDGGGGRLGAAHSGILSPLLPGLTNAAKRA